jgi:alkanesulfonate monooxygenase
MRGSAEQGIRIGLIVRADEKQAWSVAHERYPEDRRGQMTRKLATKVSDSRWHQQLSEFADADEGREDNPYWLVPFQNYKAMCPYLVGSYDRVAGELARYVDCGYTTFILDEPASEEEMQHIGFAFELATQRCAA